jgi:replicative DNA helicase Mcm
MADPQDLIQPAAEFLEQYYRDEILELANHYPQDQESLWIDHMDLYAHDADLADDLCTHPDTVLPALEMALPEVTLPVDIDLSGATIRVQNLDQGRQFAPGNIRKEQATEFVGIRGTLERVTTTSDLPELVVFECQRCGCEHPIPQEIGQSDLQEPYECENCTRQGPYDILEGRGEWSDYAKLRIESRPDVDQEAKGNITGYVLNDLIDVGGENGLLGRAGEPVVVNGVVERVQKTGRGENELLFDHHLRVNSIEFERDDDSVDVDAHKEEFTELADRPDAVDLFADSIAPNLHATEGWDAAFEFAVAYLFGAPRIDIDNGPTYRGDLHFLMITDFGMGKSDFLGDIADYSPKAIKKSTTALSSGVGLTAAAVKDDFGEGQWTIKPGLLVRANGGHLLLDEIDKGPDELTEMNDALEGEQVVDIEKAGKSATYDSKTGVLAVGNPVDSRFDPHTPVAQELGIDETLLSRFDGIVTMSDQADVEQDSKIAETFGRAYTEAQEAEYGGREEFEALERPVGVDVGRAWIQYARENVNPILRYGQFQELEEWYAEDVRQLNQKFAEEGDGLDMPVPATVRVLGAAVKMSIAFSRARLLDEVDGQAVERAKKLGKRLVKQNWTGESFDASKDQQGPDTQKAKRQGVYAVVDEHGPIEAEEVGEELGLEGQELDHHISELLHDGAIMEPRHGVYRSV